MSQKYLELFAADVISFSVPSTDKRAVIEGLLELATRKLELNPQARGHLLRKLLDREKNGSTGVGAVAIPHVKARSLTETIGALAVFPAGIDFQAVDDEPVYAVFLLLSPEDAAEEHLGALRWIAKLVRQPDFNRFVRQTSTADEAHSLLEEMGG